MTVSDDLLSKYHDLYHASITHNLTNELCSGTLPDYKLFTYLVQDLKYFKLGLNLFAKTMALCDYMPSSLIIGRQIGFISTDENDYFETTIDQLLHEPEITTMVPSMMGDTAPELPEVTQYLDYMKYLVYESNSYGELVTALYFMEQVYLGWADDNLHRGNVADNLAYKYHEWIVLHSGPEFTQWTNFLKSEVDRVGPGNVAQCEVAAKTILQLEINFFDACYDYK